MNFNIGTVTTPNPWLWVNTTNFNDYEVSSGTPGSDWVQVNQFCSILAVRWLQNPTPTLGFRDLSGGQQLADARTLQGFQSLQDQVNWAVAQLGGLETAPGQVVKNLAGYNAGTQIWLGNNVHTVAAFIRMDGKLKVVDFYNPDTGDTETYQINEFAALVPAWNISSTVVKTA